jgi:hypothetical protein
MRRIDDDAGSTRWEAAHRSSVAGLSESRPAPGATDLLTVMGDVLALTNVHYNSCDNVSGLPVTLKFADRVGDILTASPQGQKATALPFWFYI